jgi:hypothetical protein
VAFSIVLKRTKEYTFCGMASPEFMDENFSQIENGMDASMASRRADLVDELFQATSLRDALKKAGALDPGENIQLSRRIIDITDEIAAVDHLMGTDQTEEI